MTYLKGVLWFLASLFISTTLDVFQKYLGKDLHGVEITFWRFFFGSISLIPLIIYGKKQIKTTRLGMHSIRGLLLFAGISIWCYGLTIVPISTATTINFTIPLFTLIFAIPFLKEKVGITKWIATLVGFFGICIILNPTKASFHPGSLLILLSSIFFSLLDILNKKYVIRESTISTLFYTATFTMLFSFVPSIFVWKWPTLQQFTALIGLGFGANMILYCILKSFSFAEASAIVPFRYMEFVFAVIYGLVLFSEIPPISTFIGLAFIIPSTMLITLHETYYKKKKLLKTKNSIQN